MLDRNGLILALVIGIALIFIKIEFFILMIIFLGIAIVVTKHNYFLKKQLGIYEHERGWRNVLSNGLGPLLFGIGSFLFGPIPFICSVSAVMSDKFASELGVLSENPISLGNLKIVKPGTSGAVSAFGTLMSLAGAIIISVSAIWLFNITPTTALIIGIVGFIGSVIDSIFGVFEEKGIGTKETTNFICSISAGLIGIWLITNGVIL